MKLVCQTSTGGHMKLYALHNDLIGGFSTWSYDNKHLGAPIDSRGLAVGILRRGHHLHAFCALRA